MKKEEISTIEQAEQYYKEGKKIYDSITDKDTKEFLNYRNNIEKSRLSYKDVYHRDIYVDIKPEGIEQMHCIINKVRKVLINLNKAIELNPHFEEAIKTRKILKKKFSVTTNNQNLPTTKKDTTKATSFLDKEKPPSFFKQDGEIRVFCPICNNKMILRKGSYGKFWGCSRYPSCKATKDKYYMQNN